MRNRFRAYLLSVLLVSLLVAGCSTEGSTRNASEWKRRIETEMDAIAKGSVLSTDGQEVSLDVQAFLNDLPAQGKELQLSDKPLQREDVRYTLILHRKTEAPLVIEVGEQASQFGSQTYRGSGAVKFYRWVRQQVGKRLLPGSVRSIDLTAVDFAHSLSLKQQEAEAVWQLLKSAETVDVMEQRQYPLYPYYRIKLDTGERTVEATVLTPTLLSVPFGKETHYYRIHGSLFSLLTEWLPPQEAKSDPFEPLFKTTHIRIEPIQDPSIKAQTRKISETTVDQALAHQCVRLLRDGTLRDGQLAQPQQARFRLTFFGNGTETSMYVFDRAFLHEGRVYTHPELEETIRDLLNGMGK
jgi:hypothetical protein